MSLDQAQVGMWATAATALVAVVTMVVGEIRRRRHHTVAETRKAVLSESEVSGLERQMGRLADAVEAMNARQTEHETDCAGFRGRVEAEISATKGWLESTDRRLENLQTQFQRVMPASDTFVQLSPANGRVRRAKPSAAE